MSTDNLSIVTSALSNRVSTAVSSPAAQPSEAVVPSIVGKERQDVAAGGQVLPVKQVSEGRDKENQDKRLDAAVSDINSYVQKVDRKLEFSVSESLALGRAVIKVIDSETDKVIREIPSEDTLRIAKRIREQFDENSSVEGLVFSDQA